MALRTFRCNIKAAHFPLLSSYLGRSVASRSPEDSDYVVTDAYSGAAANDDIGLAQPIYMHNVMPVSHGLQSVGYATELDNSLSPYTNFDQVLVLRTANEHPHLFVPGAGVNYINSTGEDWVAQNPQSATKLGGHVTKAYSYQRSFVCYKRNGIFEYNSITKTLDPVVLAGVNANQIDGICYSNNFLILYTDDTVYWSSVLDPTDFVPSISTGSSSEKLIFARGAIVNVLPIHNGFVVYTTHNAISAYWTGDLTSPWVFREIAGSAGITNPEHVSHDSNYAAHFAWTTSGFMQLNKEGGVATFPEVTDFLTCGMLEEYIGDVDGFAKGVKERAGFLVAQTAQPLNSCANILERQTYEVPLRIKVAFIGSRYVAISYGKTTKLSHILVYDLALRRWGKLRIKHSDVFQYTNPSKQLSFGVRESFGVLQDNGNILTVDFSHDAQVTDAVLLFGRIQHGRNQVCTLMATEVDGILATNIKLDWIPSFDGATMLPAVTPLPVISNANMLKVAGRHTALNFVARLVGGFSLSSLQVSLETASGDR